MGEPLSPDRVFDFPMDEQEPHPAYDFFAPGPLPGYAGNPNNNNGWIKADMPLLGGLGVVADEPMVGLLVDEIVERIVEAEEQVIALVVDMDKDIAMMFGDDDFEDDDSEGFDEEEVGGPSTAAAEGLSFPLPASGLLVPPSVIEDLSTCLGNLEYGHRQLVTKVIQVSDVEVASGISIGEIGLRVFVVEGQVQVMASQMVHAADRFEQIGTQVEQGQQTATQRDEVITGLTQQVQALQAVVQQRDSQIQHLQTMVSEMSSHESTLMQYILGMDRRLANLERRPPGPQ
ncbi:hypothetical protein Tco_0959976 [Tanacetum coccineum]